MRRKSSGANHELCKTKKGDEKRSIYTYIDESFAISRGRMVNLIVCNMGMFNYPRLNSLLLFAVCGI